MSLSEALGPATVIDPVNGGQLNSGLDDVEMKLEPAVQAKEEDPEPQDAVMDDLFGNDDDVEAKDEDESKRR